MIPENILEGWRKNAPWPLLAQVEQDLIISRALIELYNNDYLKTRIAFRGGTALHKIILPKPLRYSEDIDLNRLETGAGGKIIDGVRDSLGEMLGQPFKVNSTDRSIKMIYKYDAIDGSQRKLKVEINVRETLPEKDLQEIPYSVESNYFQGSTKILAFNTEEMIGTKIRALYQRRKGRDLFDLFEVSKTDADWDNIVSSFKKLKIRVNQKEFMNNLEEKMSDQDFLTDMAPLLPAEVKYDINEAYEWFRKEIIPRLD
jgi:predicted nucleotidyltransferase component of viral defense system